MSSDFIVLITPTIVYSVAIFALVWMISESVRNAGIVDITWSLSFTAFALCYVLMADGLPWRRVILFLIVATWSLRLGLHIWRRVSATHPVEDERYAMIRRDWGSFRLLLFFELQAILAVILSIPHLLVSRNTATSLHLIEWIAISITLIGIGGEALADKQLRDFKNNPENKGKTCRSGLWRYSRHPNYFFEWVIWVGFALLALPAPWGWTALFAPGLMFYFLWAITGIPLTEQRALETRGEDYRKYQATTSPFFPWFPKTNN